MIPIQTETPIRSIRDQQNQGTAVEASWCGTILLLMQRTVLSQTRKTSEGFHHRNQNAMTFNPCC